MKRPGFQLPGFLKRDASRRDGGRRDAARPAAGNRPRGRASFNLRGRLQLEQATWAESNRVDQVARTRLGMSFPRTEDVVVLRR